MACTKEVSKHQAEQTPKPTSPKPFLENIAQAAPRSPLVISKDFGKTWEDVSQNLPLELEVSFLEWKGKKIVLASDNLGLFLSNEDRSEWTQIGAALPSSKINALHVAGDVIFAGAYRTGIFKSKDEGTTWQSLNYDLPNLSVQAIWQSKNQLWVGTDEGIFSLAANTTSWKGTSINAQTLSLYEESKTLVAGTSLGTAILKDGAGTWDWVREEGAVHYTHSIGNTIVELHLGGDVYFSDDWGENWSQWLYQPREKSYVYEVVKAGKYLLMSNNYGIHRSSDKGENWSLVYANEQMGFFDFLVDGDQVYGGTRNWDEYRSRQ